MGFIGVEEELQRDGFTGLLHTIEDVSISFILILARDSEGFQSSRIRRLISRVDFTDTERLQGEHGIIRAFKA